MPPQDPNLAPGEDWYIPNQGEQVADVDSTKEKSKSIWEIMGGSLPIAPEAHFGGPAFGQYDPRISEEIGDAPSPGAGILEILGVPSLIATEGRTAILNMMNPNAWIPSGIPGLSQGQAANIYGPDWASLTSQQIADRNAEISGMSVYEYAKEHRDTIDAPWGFRLWSDIIGDPLNVNLPSKIPTGVNILKKLFPKTVGTDSSVLNKFPTDINLPVGGFFDWYKSPHRQLKHIADAELAVAVQKDLQEEAVYSTSRKSGIFRADWVPVPNIPGVEILNNAIKSAKGMTKLQADAYKIARGKRIADFKETMEKYIDEVAEADADFEPQFFKDAINDAMGGDYGRVEFAPLIGDEAVTPITNNDYQEMIRFIKDRSGDNYFEYINNMKAFFALTESGVVPQPGQLKRLEDLFGSELAQALKIKEGTKGMDVALEILGIPRTIVASIDLSAALRQARPMMAAYPEEYAEAFWYMHKALVGKKGAQLVDDMITQHPLYSIAEGAGVFKADSAALGGTKLREEAFVSKWLTHLPGIGMSERAYTSFLNKFRHDIFYNTVADWHAQGITKSWQDYKDLAEMVNAGTGRGSLPQFLSGANTGRMLNALFFAPRFAMAGPTFIVKGLANYAKDPNAPVSKFWARSMASFINTGTKWLYQLELMGAEVELDPRSSDFGKGKFGPHRIDFWGGYLPLVRYFSQTAAGPVAFAKSWGKEGGLHAQRKSLTTGEIQEMELYEPLLRFLQSKLSPSGAFGRDLIEGEDFMGEATGVGELREMVPISETYMNLLPEGFQDAEMLQGDIIPERLLVRIVPMFIQDVHEALHIYDDPSDFLTNVPAVAGTVGSLYGIGFQSFETATDVKNHIAMEKFGRSFDLLTFMQQDEVNGDIGMTSYFEDKKNRRPEDSAKDQWHSGINTYVDAVSNLETPTAEYQKAHNPSPGYVARVLDSAPGETERKMIKAYLSEKHGAWQTSITPSGLFWTEERRLRNQGDAHREVKIWRDHYWSATAPEIIKSHKGKTYFTGIVDFQVKEKERQRILQDAANSGIIAKMGDGSGRPDPEDPNYLAITTRMPLYYEDSGQTPDKIEFAKKVIDYQGDMDYLSDNFFSLDRDFLEDRGYWDQYVWNKAWNASEEMRAINSEFADVLDQLIDMRKIKRGIGWFSSAEVQQLDPNGNYGLEAMNQAASDPNHSSKKTAYEISSRLLDWGYVGINGLPEALRIELGREYFERLGPPMEAALPGPQ